MSDQQKITPAAPAGPPSFEFAPDQLEALRGTGHELIPLHPPSALDKRGRPIGKAPVGRWRTDKPLDLDEAKQRLAEGRNVGVRLRETDLVVDVDPRNFDEGDDPVKRLEADLGVSLFDWPHVMTGAGGDHFYMTVPAGFLVSDTIEEYPGIEFKAHGRQLVAPGSSHPETGSPYLWDDISAVPFGSAAPAPEKLLELIRRPVAAPTAEAGELSPEQVGELLQSLDPTEFRDQARWLELMMAAHHASAGDARDEFIEWSTSDPDYADHAWIIGRRWDSLHADGGGRRVTVKTLYKALNEAGQGALVDEVQRADPLDDFPELVVPYVTDEERRRRLFSPEEDDLQGIIDSLPEGSPAYGPLEALNRKGYAAVTESDGSFRVYRRAKDYNLDPEQPRHYWQSQRKGDFLDSLANVRMQKGLADGRATVVPVAAEWLKWGGRTTYEGVTFDPSHRAPDTVLNLWTGWAVEPRTGDWSLLKRLLLEGLCAGNREMYDYALDWSALMVQRPERPARTALVFKGAKRTGKGTYFRALGHLAGRHFVHISSQHHLTGHFNAHLRDCVFLFADEALWAGDKQGEGTLKRLITEPTIVVEGKGKDVVQVRNCLHVGMASNEDWVVPIDQGETRYAVSDVAPAFKDDKAFFDALHAQMEAGGYEAMLHDLLRRDISGFDAERVPATEGLSGQMLESLRKDPVAFWWYRRLSEGQMDTLSGSEWPDAWEAGPEAKAEMVRSLEAQMAQMGRRREATSNMVARFLKGVGVDTRARNRRADRVWAIPGLDVARKAFEDACLNGGPGGWHD